MARPLIIISFLLLVIASTAHARMGSQMYKSAIPTAIKELLEPVLSSHEHCGKNIVYHDLNAPSYYYGHKRADAEGSVTFKHLMSNLSFFLEKDLFYGNTLKAIIYPTGIVPECAYLTRGVANSIPFSTAHIDQILSQFSIDPFSADAIAVRETLEFCDWPALRGEGKTCTTSLEEMEELAVTKLGNDAQPLTTKMEADSTESRSYEVKRVELKGKNYMSCHRMSYPYAVHFCHKLPATLVYEVSLLRDDGVDGQALAICHRDNSDWDAKYFAFEKLHVQPGKESLCHFYPKGHLLWIAANQGGIEQVI